MECEQHQQEEQQGLRAKTYDVAGAKEVVAHVQPAVSGMLVEQSQLTSAAGRLRCATTDGPVATGQHRLLEAKLLHAALQHERIAALQLHADAAERMQEERFGGELTACAGQLVQGLARGALTPIKDRRCA